MAIKEEHGRMMQASHRAGSLPTATLLEAALGANGAPAGTDHQIPDIVIRRLPIYVRTLNALREQDVGSVSSEELASTIGVSAAQIRRDLSYFGKFGKQGKGYDTEYLAASIGTILRLDRLWPVALAGVGKLGLAIANYQGFAPSSFKIAALFDGSPRHIGDIVNGLEILPNELIADVVQREGIKIGIISVRAPYAQEVAERMIEGGIEAILNYAPVILRVPANVTVREVDPVSALQSMTYYLQ